ncbi:MAG TPA: cytochrome c family protein [Sphingomonas sp.]|nr:cytochrome c family protein [Sphingomonas sp.]
MKIAMVCAGLALLGVGAGVGWAGETPPGGDAAHGKQVFARCTACHKVGPGARSGIGPALNGVVDRKAGTVPGFRYSAAMRRSGLTWDRATLARFLQAPAKVVPGTRMAFPGISKPQDEADLITYLAQFAPDGSTRK